MTELSLLGELAWKGTVILAAAFLAAAMLRRASAAARHFLWTEALAALLLLPAAISVAPRWKVQPVVKATAGAAAGEAAGSFLIVRPGPANPLPSPWLLLWAVGCGIVALRWATGEVRTRQILRRAKTADYAEEPGKEIAGALGIRRNVAMREAADVPIPLACGLWRPTVVLPAHAAAWPEARLRMVLRHELAHIRRWDLAAQALGQAVCCLYWFHPLAWMAARRLRKERESACDDAVLAGGASPHQYAADLVDLARGVAARRRAWADKPAMAEASDLETRVRDLFDRQRNRGPLGTRAALAIEIAMLALLLPVASLTVHAQPARGGLAGVVQDPSGARVPFCRVAAKNQDGANEEMTRANAAGEYRFAAIPPGEYILEAASPGFMLAKVKAAVTSGQAARMDISLSLGSVSETMTISGQKPATVTPNATPPQRIRVGGMVQPVRLLEQVKPEYPAALQQAGVQGTVLIRGTISKEGEVLSPQVVNTEIDPRLAQLALEAFRQWHYQPSLLNGEPVETVTTVNIDFKLN